MERFVEHVCEGRDERQKKFNPVTVFLNWLSFGPTVRIEDGMDRRNYAGQVIHVTFCPFCGMNLKGQLASQKLIEAGIEMGNIAAH